MNIIRTLPALRAVRRAVKGPVVLVPTMGALHEGHAALIREARRRAGRNGTVAVSIFVNPIQFGPSEDLSSYPRPWRRDLAVCRTCRADVVFAPRAEDVYAPDRSVVIDETALSGRLCGASRPGHFRGVCTVVAKLFLIVQPDAAVFGEKDWQQLAIIRRLVRDLNFPVRVIGHPTVRESDGLALSSRNAYLTAEERAVAPRIHAALRIASEGRTARTVMTAARRALEKIPGARVDYVELVDAETLQPVTSMRRPMRLAAAVFLGRARLIDNIAVSPQPSKTEA